MMDSVRGVVNVGVSVGIHGTETIYNNIRETATMSRREDGTNGDNVMIT